MNTHSEIFTNNNTPDLDRCPARWTMMRIRCYNLLKIVAQNLLKIQEVTGFVLLSLLFLGYYYIIEKILSCFELSIASVKISSIDRHRLCLSTLGHYPILSKSESMI